MNEMGEYIGVEKLILSFIHSSGIKVFTIDVFGNTGNSIYLKFKSQKENVRI